MGQIESFKEEDRNTMQLVLTTLEKMYQTCESISQNFKKHFGDIRKKSWVDQIPFRNRYGIVSKHGVFIENSAIFVGFNFDKDLSKEAPVLQVLLWCKSDNDLAILDLAEKEKFKCKNWDADGIGIYVEEPLSSFITIENQSTEINRWFETTMEMFQKFINDR